MKKNYLTFFIQLLIVLPGFSQEPIQISVDIKDQNFNSGIHEFQAYDTITMTNVTVDGGVGLTLRSLNIVNLNPGVSILSGANFQIFADKPLVSMLMEEGTMLANIGDYDGAINKFNQVLDIYPGHTLANYTLGLLYDKKGDSGTAIAYLEKVLLLAVTSDPLLPQAHYRLGLWKFPSDPYNFHFDKVLELVSANDPLAIMVREVRINYHFSRGLSLLDAGDCNGASMEFQQVLQIDSDHARSHYRLAISYICLGDFDCTLVKYHLQRFIELAPDDPEVPTAKDMLTYILC